MPLQQLTPLHVRVVLDLVGGEVAHDPDGLYASIEQWPPLHVLVVLKMVGGEGVHNPDVAVRLSSN